MVNDESIDGAHFQHLCYPFNVVQLIIAGFTEWFPEF